MKSLFEQGMEVIGARTDWEQKQRLFYQMRHDGIRRAKKPFPGAADAHFPLVDMTIGKIKPFWGSQATGAERLASFVALNQQQQAITTAAADFYDFELKQNSNFQIELIRAVDWMLLRGRGVFKMVVDPFNDYRIVCEAPDPVYIIMADGAEDFDDADWFVHVQHHTVASYKRNRRYRQDEALINKIRGQKDLDITTSALADKQMREGVNFSRNADQIILWEHYVKTMAGWLVHTYSPMAPEEGIRKVFPVAYKIRGKVSCPYFSFKTEIKDKGWYSPRGVAELSGAFEAYTCKLWNEKSDAMTFGNRPLFTSEQQISNTANIRWNPGEFIPGNVKAVQMPAPAFSFDQEIAFARSVSEQRNMVPDFGITTPGEPGGDKPRTATENNRIANLQSIGTQHTGWIFCQDLARVHRHGWGLILQFKRKNLVYFASSEIKELPEQALHDAYLIQPDGSPEDWNKQQRQQRADARLQKYANSPNVDQDVLVRDSLAADDPKLAQEAFIPSQVKAGSEAEDEAVEIVILCDGFPAQVKPNEDHATRIHVLLSWLQAAQLQGRPVDPIAKQRVQEHLAVHFQYLQKLQPQAAKQLLQEIHAAEAQAAAQRPAGPGGPPAPAAPGAGAPPAPAGPAGPMA
ncbi:MAG TPA: hypothetical protein VHA37_04490 [Candidatus Saccharimonadales bacterium]|nr:hypothetical protein [Candidatus Saccharimonadales bacterium]